MPKWIVLKVEDHIPYEEAEEFAQQINECFQPHNEAIVLDPFTQKRMTELMTEIPAGLIPQGE